MNDAELDALVARLVPEFEQTKLQAIEARDGFLAMTSQACFDRETLMLTHARWQALESCCQAILDRIDQLAERNAA
jgi:hypothetical protein